MSETLCWMCARPGTGGCSWDRELAPVPGWTAREAMTDGFQTYHVIACPLFQEMDWKSRPDAWSGMIARMLRTAPENKERMQRQ